MSPLDRDLARALDAYSVQPLSAGFADRVTAMALSGQSLPAALPPRRSGRTRWMPRHRVALGLIAGALMSATAAAAGVFGDLGVTIPALRKMAEQIALVEPVTPAAAPPRRAAAPLADASDTAEAAAIPVGPALTPEQLEARFRAADARRETRRAVVTERMEAVIDRRIERREAAGLPVPSPEQREAVRARIQQRVAERDAVASERRETHRDALRELVRERQTEVAATPAPAPAPSATPSPPANSAADTADTADTVEASAGDNSADTANRRPTLTPAQREALRQRRAERLERLRRLRRQQ